VHAEVDPRHGDREAELKAVSTAGWLLGHDVPFGGAIIARVPSGSAS
jgi:hypothetical protein